MLTTDKMMFSYNIFSKFLYLKIFIIVKHERLKSK